MEKEKETILLPVCHPVSFLRIGPHVREETRRRLVEKFIEDLKERGLSFYFEEEKDGHIVTAYSHVFAVLEDEIGPLRKVSLLEEPFFRYATGVETDDGSRIVALDGKIGYAEGCIYDIIDVPPRVRAVLVRDGEERVLEPGYYIL